MPGFLIDFFILGLEVQKINNIFRETKIKKALVRVLLRIVPDLIEKKIKKVLSKNIFEKEIKQYFLKIKKYISKAIETET